MKGRASKSSKAKPNDTETEEVKLKNKYLKMPVRRMKNAGLSSLRKDF